MNIELRCTPMHYELRIGNHFAFASTVFDIMGKARELAASLDLDEEEAGQSAYDQYMAMLEPLVSVPTFIEHCNQGYGKDWKGIVLCDRLEGFTMQGARHDVERQHWVFPCGATLRFAVCTSPDAYWGHAYPFVDATRLDPELAAKMKFLAKTTRMDIPLVFEGGER